MYSFVQFCKKKNIFVYLFEHEKVYFSIRVQEKRFTNLQTGIDVKRNILFPILF